MSAPAPLWHEARFWRQEGEAIVCTLCPLRCRVREGGTGQCRVRRVQSGRMETATFATSVRHHDPIERKPLYHFRPGSRTLTLAAPGCTFSCSYCQNSRLSQWGREEELAWTASEVDPESILGALDEGDILAFSYSEPTLASDLTLAVFDACGGRDLDIVWKTNGFITPEALEEVAPALAAVNVDLKAIDEKRHRELTGVSVEPVLDALPRFGALGIWLEVSTPIIPGFNSDPDTVRAMAEAILALGGAETPWHLLRFHPDYRLTTAPPTTPEELRAAAQIARDVGLRHVYVERALGANGRATCCPQCEACVVERGIWSLERNALSDGACPHCAYRLPGRWRPSG